VKSGVWEPAGALHKIRALACATTHNSVIIVAGGVRTGVIERFLPFKNEWEICEVILPTLNAKKCALVPKSAEAVYLFGASLERSLIINLQDNKVDETQEMVVGMY
jgi:hypothetical protein